ncbi:MAG TPA: L,D-transpeptidase [Coleofasciculaceae cyanobacterium]|jgi:lipoprotein-anchoring transpeptidase ErfK/SrfK
MNRQWDRRLRQLSLWGSGALLGLALGMPEVGIGNLIPPAQAHDASQDISSLRQSGDRWIEVNVSTQRLIAWEGNQPVYAVIVSTGTDEHPTLTGTFAIEDKLRVTRMQGDDYDVPDVPYTMYYDGGYAIHGAYWHQSFGTPVSHGCVNVAVDHARWLFNWASVGTPVVVRN